MDKNVLQPSRLVGPVRSTVGTLRLGRPKPRLRRFSPPVFVWQCIGEMRRGGAECTRLRRPFPDRCEPGQRGTEWRLSATSDSVSGGSKSLPYVAGLPSRRSFLRIRRLELGSSDDRAAREGLASCTALPGLRFGMIVSSAVSVEPLNRRHRASVLSGERALCTAATTGRVLGVDVELACSGVQPGEPPCRSGAGRMACLLATRPAAVQVAPFLPKPPPRNGRRPRPEP
jgi:hypothetical protein